MIKSFFYWLFPLFFFHFQVFFTRFLLFFLSMVTVKKIGFNSHCAQEKSKELVKIIEVGKNKAFFIIRKTLIALSVFNIFKWNKVCMCLTSCWIFHSINVIISIHFFKKFPSKKQQFFTFFHIFTQSFANFGP